MSAHTAEAVPLQARRDSAFARPGGLHRLATNLRRHQTVVPGLVVILLMVLVAFLADVISPWNPLDGSLDARLARPFSRIDHLLGTDPIGRDVLSRLIHGARISLLVGFASVVSALVIGSLLGLIAGYFGGWVEIIIMRVADIQLSFPQFLLAITLMAALGSGLFNVVLALSIGGWVRYARVIRSSVLPLREVEYVLAARVIGASGWRTMTRHVLPNALTPVLVLATLSLGANIITESSLSFLGLGVDPQTPSWGAMLSDGRSYLATAWWVAAMPGLAISATVLAINIVGDWLRDELDPRLKRR